MTPPFRLWAAPGARSRDLDLADGGCDGALGDVEGQKPERVLGGCGIDGPPDRVDRVPVGCARGERELTAKRAVVALEGGEHDAAFVRLMAVGGQGTGHGASLLLCRRRDIGAAPWSAPSFPDPAALLYPGLE